MALSQSTHGFDSLAYIGSPYNPVVSYFQPKDPVPENNLGIPLGTIWLNTLTQDAFMLTAKLYDGTVKKTLATWSALTFGTGAVLQVTTDSGVAHPTAGNINLFGGNNINTNAVGDDLYVNLDTIINLPNTNGAGTAGEFQFAGLRWISNFGTNNTFVGQDSGNTTVTGNNNSAFGAGAGLSLGTSLQNTFLGSSAGAFCIVGNYNTAVGFASLNVANSSRNTAVGRGSLSFLGTGTDNIALGNLAGANYTTTESSNICIGNDGTRAENNVIRIGTDGIGAGQQNTCHIAGDVIAARGLVSTVGNITAELGNVNVLDGNINLVDGNLQLTYSDGNGGSGYIYTGYGISAGRFISNPGVGNTFVGESSGSFIPTLQLPPIIPNATQNCALGYLTFGALTYGSYNVAIGSTALSSLTHGFYNTVVGTNSMTALTTGTGNTVLGQSALIGVTTGSSNLALGGNAGSACVTGTENSNVFIQNNGVNNQSHTIRIGTDGGGDGQQNRCWIAAIRGVTTDVADAIPVLIDSTGQLGTISSSERVKENIEDMGPESDMIMALRPVTFTYKSDASQRMQFGLIAEEVADLFPKLVVYDEDGLPDTIRYHELPVLLLNELQKYAVVIDELKERIEKLERSTK